MNLDPWNQQNYQKKEVYSHGLRLFVVISLYGHVLLPTKLNPIVKADFRLYFRDQSLMSQHSNLIDKFGYNQKQFK